MPIQPTDVTEVSMPELGESITFGTVTRWLKNVGDSVDVGEPLLEVSTDKVDTEIPSPVAGVIVELLAAEDDSVDVGGPLARVGESPGQVTQPDRDDAKSTTSKTESREQATEPAPPQRVPEAEAIPDEATPSCPSGYPETPADTGSRDLAGTAVPMSRLRQIIAQRMNESLAVSAQLTSVQEVDVTRIVRLRQRAKLDFERREGVKLTFLPFFAKAVIETLAAFPAFNASVGADGKSVIHHHGVHLAIAVDTPRGLLVPVVRDAQDLSLGGLARKIADVAERTRSNTIKVDELNGGTFTITNIGSVKTLLDTPIINQPQVAILATGAIYRRPAVVTGPDGEDQIAVRSMCYLPLTYDHRVIDGADAGRFVGAVRARIEEGAFESDLVG
ncbi:2-oxo acid dehydrogenase subunit E2 [Saccharopolyspora shandongensis]